jgi:5-methylcytosine-specific restriction endonuclease McrBC regulatory subunit McrC
MPPSALKGIAKIKRPERRMIVLPDQGAALKLTPSSLGLQSRDKSWNGFLDSFLRANGEYLKALDIDLSFSAGIDTVDLSLKANGIVGAVPLRAPDTHKTIGGIIVEPRFGWGSVGSIFASLGWSSTPELLSYPLVPGSAQQVPPWIIGGPIVTYLEKLLNYSLPAFREVEEVLSSPRGAIDWPKYAGNQLARGKAHLLPCKYSDLQPDYQLRRYIRWTLEKVASDLGGDINSDNAARSLWTRISFLLSKLNDVRPLLPERGQLDQLQRNMQRRDKVEELGFTAIKWVLDERGLAGNTDLDGLSWRIVMHELFENWVEQLVRRWAKEFGGRVSCARKHDSQSPIRWERSGVGSLSSLIPDVVVETADDTFIFDAKYKGFLEETEDLRWRDAQEMFKAEHRHDLHQVLAYASMYQTPRVTVALVYPTTFDNWTRLSERDRDVSMGTLDGPGRQIRLAIIAVPLEAGNLVQSVLSGWERIRSAQ